MVSKRITKTAAHEIAKIAANKTIQITIDSLEKNISEKCMEISLVQTPKEILDLWRIYPLAFVTTNYIRPECGALREYCFYTLKPVPTAGIANKWNNELKVQVDAETYNWFVSKKKLLEKAKHEKSIFISKTEATLLSLKTYKKVEEQLPEIVPFIPAELLSGTSETAIALPLKELKDLLTNYQNSNK